MGLDPIQHIRQDALRLGDRQAAGGQGRAGNGVAGQGGRGTGICKAQLGQALLNAAALVGTNIAKQHILVWGQTHFQLKGLHQAPQPGLPLPFQSAAKQRQADEPCRWRLTVPAEVIVETGFGLAPQGVERLAEIPAQFVLEPGEAAVMDQIFHPRVGSVLAIAVVPLQGHDRLDQRQDLRCRHIPQGFGQTGEGALLVVSATHAATHIDIAAAGPTGWIGEQHQSNVLGEQIDGVIARHGHRDLEFAR